MEFGSVEIFFFGLKNYKKKNLINNCLVTAARLQKILSEKHSSNIVLIKKQDGTYTVEGRERNLSLLAFL